MRAGRPLRPSLSGWRLGLASLLVLLAPIIVVTLLLTEFDVLQQNSDDAFAAEADDGTQSTLVLDQSQTALAEDVALQTEAESAATEPPAEDDSGAADDDEAEQTYIVVPGDTLASIARRFGSDVFAMAAFNELEDINRLDVGDELRIPPPGYEAPPAELAADGVDATETEATQ